MKENIYPKVLIIGNTFDDKTGTGITLANLFKGWPSDKLAIAVEGINYEDILGTDFCNNYYKLGNKEYQYLFPINLLFKFPKSGKIDLNQIYLQKENIPSNRGKLHSTIYEFYSHYILPFLIFSGLNDIKIKEKTSADFIQWINDFNPDIIYTLLGSLSSIRFMMELKNKVNYPIAIHIMDDWVQRKRLFNGYWLNILQKEFTELLSKTSVNMSICESMSQEYFKRYNYNFLPFHNPINASNWKDKMKRSWHIDGTIKILYVGKINEDNKISLMDMCKAVDELRKEKFPVEFEIFATKNTKFIIDVSNIQGVKIMPSVTHKEIPSLITKSDLLFLPLDFTKVSIQYAKYSMPTKATEYMISGVPTIIYCHSSLALNKYASSKKWGYVISENNVEELVKGIKILCENEDLRKEIGLRAQSLALSEHEDNIVRERFRKALSFSENLI
jgi:glycosyltransferase involved in cell wall biosynthesis